MKQEQRRATDRGHTLLDSIHHLQYIFKSSLKIVLFRMNHANDKKCPLHVGRVINTNISKYQSRQLVLKDAYTLSHQW